MVFGAVVMIYYVRADRLRRRAGGDREPALRSSRSLAGLALEGVAFAIPWTFRSEQQSSTVLAAVSMILAAASLVFFAGAIRQLGAQFRVKAVVTADHQLLTTGPYRLVRHPVYAAMFGFLVAHVLLLCSWKPGIAALAIYVVGTEIRVRVEERLLSGRFPDAFAAYRSRVKAYVPFVR